MKRSSIASEHLNVEASPQGWLFAFLRAGKLRSRRAGLERLVRAAALFGTFAWLGVLLAHREVPAAEFAVPDREELAVRAVLLRNAGSGLGGGASVDVLVHADVVVERAELDEAAARVGAFDDDARNRRLERAEEALNLSVHPGTRNRDDLKLDAEYAKCGTHQPGLQARLVVDADFRREAELANGGDLRFRSSR